MSEADTIPNEAQEAIKQISAAHNADEDELTEEFTELLDEEQEKGVSDPVKRALRRLSLSRKGGQTQDAETLRGFVLGASDAINTTASKINNAKKYVAQNGPAKAAKQGLIKKVPGGDLPDELASITVTPDGGEAEVYAVLDPNDNSPTSGEILPEEDYIRYVHGAVWRAPDDGPHWFSGVLDADEDGVKPEVPTVNEPVRFDAVWVGDSDQNNTIRLRFRDDDPFDPIEEFGGPSVIELLEDEGALGHVSLAEAHTEDYGRNDIFATHGSVTYMELNPDEGQSRRLSIVDPFAYGDDLERTVWLPDHVDVNFAEESDVYVVGQPSPGNEGYPDSIEALGVVPHPDYVVDRSGVESMGGDEDPETTDEGPEQPDSGVVPEEDRPDEEAEAAVQPDEPEEKVAYTEEIEEAGYTELQNVAADVDEVPGSGISEEEMRLQLTEELGTEELTGILAVPDTVEEEPESEAEFDERMAKEAVEEEEEDQGDFEPTDEDADWEW